MDNEVMISTRESFGKALAEIENENIVVLDADLSSSTKTEYFENKHPERFIECGIAEADMIGTSAGLATCGKIPFCASFAVFATGRVYDQIRTSVAYPNLNVKICGTHSGLTVGEDGATHQMLEDIALMRVLPNMTVISPADDLSTKKLVKIIAEYDGPVYLRLGRAKSPVLYTENHQFAIGKSHQFGKGKDATIFAIGDVLNEALKAKKTLANKGIQARVIDMYSIKPIDKEMILKCATETQLLVSVEDHSIIGGLGSAIAEVLCDEYPKKLIRMGVHDKFGKSGKPEELLKHFEFDENSIANTICNNL